MKTLAPLQRFSRRLHVLQETRTATDYQACRTSGLVFITWSLTIVVPAVLVNFLIDGRMLRRMLRLLVGIFSSKALDVSGVLLPLLVNFFIPAIIAAIIGMWLLLWSLQLRRQIGFSSHGRLCGILLLAFAVVYASLFLVPLLPFPWRAMGFSTRMRTYPGFSLYLLYTMEGPVVIPHVLAIVVLWGLALFVGWSTIVQPGKEG